LESGEKLCIADKLSCPVCLLERLRKTLW
jgi:hypothetical protein